MIYSKLNTYDAYQSGLKTRLDQRSKVGDMPYSIHRLLECHNDFTGTKEELARIGEYARGNKDLRYSFKHCMPEDKHIWAKQVAAHICFNLGRDLAGVIHGLPGDGVSKAVVKNIKNVVDRRIPALLNLGESARTETQAGWKYVSKELGTGHCAVDLFLDECIDLINWVMSILIWSQPKSPSGPFENFVKSQQKNPSRAQP